MNLNFSVLILACILTPYILGFVERENDIQDYIETTVDFIFLIDIVFNFHFAYVNDKLEIVDSKSKIASNYLKTWFLVDLMASIPFDPIFRLAAAIKGSSVTSGSFGQVAKLIKLARLMRILKIIKEKDKVQALISSILRLKEGKEQIFFFILLFLTLTHICASLWAFMAKFNDSWDDTWIR